jgi:hypothetical protein
VPVTPWRLRRDAVEVGVTAVGGMLDPVRFRTERGSVEPMHRAPWVDDPPPAVPMLQHLRGDFFCAPFGASDLLDGEPRPHGTPANGSWQLLHQDEHELRLELGGRVMGARVLETIRLVPGHPVVYQRYELVGGSGRLPLGHHAMLHASEWLRLSFAPYRWGATPPHPVESAASGGRSLLAYPQAFERLERVRAAAGGTVDLSRFPTLERSEEIVLLASDTDRSWTWSATVAPRALGLVRREGPLDAARRPAVAEQRRSRRAPGRAGTPVPAASRR